MLEPANKSDDIKKKQIRSNLEDIKTAYNKLEDLQCMPCDLVVQTRTAVSVFVENKGAYCC